MMSACEGSPRQTTLCILFAPPSPTQYLGRSPCKVFPLPPPTTATASARLACSWEMQGLYSWTSRQSPPTCIHGLFGTLGITQPTNTWLRKGSTSPPQDLSLSAALKSTSFLYWLWFSNLVFGHSATGCMMHLWRKWDNALCPCCRHDPKRTTWHVLICPDPCMHHEYHSNVLIFE